MVHMARVAGISKRLIPPVIEFFNQFVIDRLQKASWLLLFGCEAFNCAIEETARS